MEKQQTFQRLSKQQLYQHGASFVTIFSLLLTGLPIKYHYAWWAKGVVAIFGGFDNMLMVHIGFAILFMIVNLWHLIWLISTFLQGKGSLAMLPNFKDGADILNDFKYFFGLRKERASYDRYSYKEKMEYWAEYWGLLVIGLSGVILTWPTILGDLPGWIYDVARIAHSNEAVLATLAVFIWHFYGVHFHPRFFPMGRAWITGKISRDEMHDEHPLELERLEKEE